MQHVEVAGKSIPALGLGTFELTGDTCRQSVQTALAAGYRHIDTAEYYENEQAVGDGIASAPVEREDVFLTTKIWRSNLRKNDLIAAAEASRDRLDVAYLDLLLVHWPHPRVPLEETLEAMDELVERGLTRHIGVSNFIRAQLSEAQSLSQAGILTDQVLYHPYKDQHTLHEHCVETGTALTAYSPLARGSVLGDRTLEEIGTRYGKSPAQVTLRWLIQQSNVVAIPRSSSPEHIEANIDIFDFELTPAEMETIHELSGGLSVRLRNKLPALVRSLPL